MSTHEPRQSSKDAPLHLVETSQRLQGKVALVTGVGHGIGKGTALMFARHGALVIGCDVAKAAAEATSQEADAAGVPFAGVMAVDLTKEDEVAELAAFTLERAGGANVLVNAAAFTVMKWIEDMSLDDFRTTLTGELDLVFLACKAIWPQMKARGGGSIINFSSANSHMALRGSPALAHCAGKGGVLAMTHQLAMEGAPHNIRANSIAPGLVVTAATGEFVSDPARAEAVTAAHMIPRLGKPEDIGWAAVFLASDESSWVTAAEFRIDGGVTRW